MKHVLRRLKEWRQEDPTIKAIIISSFVSFLDLLDTFLTNNGVACVRYVGFGMQSDKTMLMQHHPSFQGSSSADDRREALDRLEKDPQMRVMLLSLKAGGVGLNLTSACRIISLDLAWSEAVELQAHGASASLPRPQSPCLTLSYRPRSPSWTKQQGPHRTCHDRGDD